MILATSKTLYIRVRCISYPTSNKQEDTYNPNPDRQLVVIYHLIALVYSVYPRLRPDRNRRGYVVGCTYSLAVSLAYLHIGGYIRATTSQE